MIKKILTGIILITVFIVIYFVYVINQTIEISKELLIEIKPNSSTSKVISTYNQIGALKPSFLFNSLAKTFSVFSGKHIQTGYFKYEKSISNLEILKSLFSRQYLYLIDVTFPEGITCKQFAEILGKKLDINPKEFLDLTKNDSILKKYKIRYKSVEGYLMPETYQFSYKQNTKELIQRLLDEQLKIWNSKWNNLLRTQKLSKHEILTLASIVEAETPIDAEKPRIAGVYLNRLNKNMRLEADPTVQFALNGKKHLSLSDLNINNPYNTYRNFGLPPGPINNPGKASINAIMNAEKHNYLFFVAVGDGSQKHNFAKTYNEHLINVSLYKKNK